MKTLFHHAQDGFSLIEALCAIALLAIGIMSLYTMQIGAIHANGTANIVSLGSNRATDQIERLLNMNFDDLVDGNGNGNGTVNGIDPTGREFGLNDTQNPLPPAGTWPSCADLLAPSVADFCDDTHPPYVVFYNVANDIPVPGARTIRVLVVSQDRGQRVVLPLTYFRTRE